MSQVVDANRFLCLCDRGEQLRRGHKNKNNRSLRVLYLHDDAIPGKVAPKNTSPVPIHCPSQNGYCEERCVILLHSVWCCNAEIEIMTVIVLQPECLAPTITTVPAYQFEHTRSKSPSADSNITSNSPHKSCLSSG